MTSLTALLLAAVTSTKHHVSGNPTIAWSSVSAVQDDNTSLVNAVVDDKNGTSATRKLHVASRKLQVAVSELHATGRLRYLEFVYLEAGVSKLNGAVEKFLECLPRRCINVPSWNLPDRTA